MIPNFRKVIPYVLMQYTKTYISYLISNVFLIKYIKILESLRIYQSTLALVCNVDHSTDSKDLTVVVFLVQIWFQVQGQCSVWYNIHTLLGRAEDKHSS